jgi:endonuclease YncB( thermonuclease family)
MKLSALAAALAFAASPALAQSARAVDGDTLKVDGVTYRFWGIDAPESG